MTCQAQADSIQHVPQPSLPVGIGNWSVMIIGSGDSASTVTCQVNLRHRGRTEVGSGDGVTVKEAARRAIAQAVIALDVFGAGASSRSVPMAGNSAAIEDDEIGAIICRFVAGVNQVIGAVPSADIPEAVVSAVGGGSCCHCDYEGAD